MSESTGLIGIPKKGARGGHFDALPQQAGFAPGDPAHSAEGWVVFASNLDASTTEDDVKDFFSTFGKIHIAKFLTDALSCECLGCAAVEFLDFNAAKAAVENGNGVPFVNDVPIRVAFAFVVPEPDADAQDGLETTVVQNPARRFRTRDEEAEEALKQLREQARADDDAAAVEPAPTESAPVVEGAAAPVVPFLGSCVVADARPFHSKKQAETSSIFSLGTFLSKRCFFLHFKPPRRSRP